LIFDKHLARAVWAFFNICPSSATKYNKFDGLD
jgi:hypothetical protein